MMETCTSIIFKTRYNAGSRTKYTFDARPGLPEGDLVVRYEPARRVPPGCTQCLLSCSRINYHEYSELPQLYIDWESMTFGGWLKTLRFGIDIGGGSIETYILVQDTRVFRTTSFMVGRRGRFRSQKLTVSFPSRALTAAVVYSRPTYWKDEAQAGGNCE